MGNGEKGLDPDKELGNEKVEVIGKRQALTRYLMSTMPKGYCASYG